MPQPLSTDEIRKRWIAFFAGKNHKHLPSDSLVPQNDPSVLFTGAGMNQFKDNFLGRARLEHPQQRAVTVQKCIRTGDIENVGRTPNHHTLFEMLGNFSFGDYFKKEAIQWAWEFLLDKDRGLGLEPERLSVTIFGGDAKLGIPKDSDAETWWRLYAQPLQNKDGSWRIYQYGEHDNFWPADAPSLGPNGPCGPCSEIYYDMKPHQGQPEPVASSQDPARYVEIWNLVFTQFNRIDVGKLEPLSQKNIDTGAGLERMARVLQRKNSNFEIDLLFPIVQEVARLSGKQYGHDKDDDRRMRRITDHARAAVFCIADGVGPKNEGRNYVVRRLMRRAILDGRELGIAQAFLGQVAKLVIKQMSVGYPELAVRSATIARLIEEEENAFGRTLQQGRQHFDDVVAKLQKNGGKVISGADAFRLWDTFGFPLELTVELAQAQNIRVNDREFEAALEEGRKRSQEGSAMDKAIFATGPVATLKEKYVGQKTVFEGYNATLVRGAKILALIQNSELTEEAKPGVETLVLVDRTPFYGESGGQVGDRGIIFERNMQSGDKRAVTTTLEMTGLVQDTQKADGLILHSVKLRSPVRVGDTVSLEVDTNRRVPTLKNHSATHLLHYALRTVLGAHVEQRGSLVAPDRLRFDFTHFEQIKPDQLATIETMVNNLITSDVTVKTEELPIAQAKAKGAMALFGEKYGDVVRVVSMGPSVELCGGTHCQTTGQIGYFRIVSESSVAAGVRRVEALTGINAVGDARKTEETLAKLALMLKVKKEAVHERIVQMLDERAHLERELESSRKKAANAVAGDLLSHAKDVGGTKLLVAGLEGADAAALRTTLDGIRKTMKEGAVVLGGNKDGKVALLVSFAPEVVDRGGHAGNLLKELAPKVGGKGGGKPDMAQGGGTDTAKMAEALQAAEGLLLGMLKK